MSLYLFLSIYVFSFVAIILDFISFTKKKYIYWAFIILLISVASLKNSETSADTANYVISLTHSKGIADFFSISTFRFEPGYVIIESIVATLGGNPYLLFFIVSSLTIFIYGNIISKYSPYPFLSLFIYISLFYFKREIIIIRYGLSCAIMLLAIISMIKGEKKRFILFSILSSFFHYTGLSCFFLWIICWVVKNNRVVVMEIVTVCSLFFSLCGITILSVIIFSQNFLPEYFSYAISKGLGYLEGEDTAGMKQLIPYLPIILFYHLKKNYSFRFSMLYFCFLFSIFFMVELNQAASFSRIGQMYTTVLVLLYPCLLKETNKNNFILIYIYVIVFSLYSFVRMSFFNEGGFINLFC